MNSSQNHPSKELIRAFAEGRLLAEVSIGVEEHLLNCGACCEHLTNREDDELIDLAKRANQPDSVEQSMLNPGAIPSALVNHPRYQVLESIAVGAMGVVYRAEHLLMKRTVALKVIHPRFLSNTRAVKRFHQEVRIAAQLQHPNIVTSFDAEQAGEYHFLVMEFVDGVTLAELVKRDGPATVSQALALQRQAASALEHAHQLGLTHRDIKPANLMVTQSGKLKILDFGLSRLDTDHWAARVGYRLEKNLVTRSDMFLGTPGYVSPEQIANPSQADIRSDIYSLGCTLYFLLVGRSPFARETVVHTLLAQQHESLPDVRQFRDDIPKQLVDVLNRMTARSPADRYATPSDLLDALHSVEHSPQEPTPLGPFLTLVESPKSPTSTEDSDRRKSYLRWQEWIAILAAIIVLTLLLG